MIVEHAYPQKLGIKSERSAGLWDWDTLPAWKATVEAIHRHGAQAAIEIGHLGRCTDYPSSIGEKAMAPSAVRCPVAQAPTRAVGREEIEAYKSDYLNAVRLARTAGFDAVELHFANGYFLAEWISGRSNKRTDRYGGTFGNRARLALELTELVREEVGPDYPLLARFASREVNGGRGIEESRVFAKLLEEAGVNCLDINAGSPSEYDWEFPSYFQPQGFLLEDIERIRPVGVHSRDRRRAYYGAPNGGMRPFRRQAGPGLHQSRTDRGPGMARQGPERPGGADPAVRRLYLLHQ